MTTEPKSNHKSADGKGVRLQKLLASAGLGSRRSCETLILDGRVTVDGRQIRELGTRVDPNSQRILVDGEPIRPERMKYYLLNKPPGYLCTTRDPAGRKRALDLIADEDTRLFTVGRLDENSRGVLLVTNDGELAQRLAHPRYGIPKTYRVQVAGKPSLEILSRLRRGVYVAEGRFQVQQVRRVGNQGNSTFLEIVLTEGRNREIRRMLAALGHKVMFLERVAFGPLWLGRLPVGRFRRLTLSELRLLRSLVAGGAGAATEYQAAIREKGRGPRRASSARRLNHGRHHSPRHPK